MKKTIIILLCFLAFYQAVRYFNNKADEEFFGDFYTKDYDMSDGNAEPTFIDKAEKFIKDLFGGKKEEKFIYK